MPLLFSSLRPDSQFLNYVKTQQLDLNKDGVYDKNDIKLAKESAKIGDLLSGQQDLNNDGVIDKNDKKIAKDIAKIQKTLEKQNIKLAKEFEKNAAKNPDIISSANFNFKFNMIS